MYIHAGGIVYIDVRSIVAIVKMHPTKAEKHNPLVRFHYPFELVMINEKTNNESIKCYIITDNKIYGTPISHQTIVSRYEKIVQDFYKN